MTDDPIAPVTVETNGAQEHMVRIKERSSQDYFVFRRTHTFVVLSGFIAALVLGAVAFLLIYRETQSQLSASQDSVVELTTDVRLLREQLGEAQNDLEAQSDASEELTACRAALTNATTEALSTTMIELTELIALLANDVQDDMDPAVAEQAAAGQRLRDALQVRAEFEVNGAELPCPIPAAG